jgi:hypothetical protein
VLRIVLSTLGGLAVGGAFFALLRLNVRFYTSRHWPLGIALHFGRWTLLTIALVVAARMGALPLLCLAGGILIARTVLVRPTPEVRA